MKTCVCGEWVGPGRTTCGNSYCQEADYRLTIARCSRGLRKIQAQKDADKAVAIAQENKPMKF